MTIRVSSLILLLLLSLLATGATLGQEQQPLESDTIERSTVRLMLLDVVVLDKDGRTVTDLSAEDFEIHAAGEIVPVDTLDLACEEGATDDVRAVARPGQRQAAPANETQRRIVLALDYLHLPQLKRAEVLEEARSMVKSGAAERDEIMVAALNGGLRIEQTFTTDRESVMRTLKRMEYDITLWEPNFFHQSENGFVRGMTALFDVLGTVPGPKAVVLFSGMSDIPLDLQFRQLAGVATTARCSIYPMDVRGLVAPSIGIDVPPG